MLQTPEYTNIARKMDFHYPEFKVGQCVGICYKLQDNERYGRIVELKVKYPPNHKFNHLAMPYGVFVVRMEDGSYREEHPEHLVKAKPRKPVLVDDSFGSELFGIATIMMKGCA